MAEGFVQTNINLTEEDSKVLDLMMVEDAYDNRSAFVRRLIRLEWQRRQQLVEMAKTPTTMTMTLPDRH
jgi:Arc/MetJ-type ribon-helix-helix transcriptional regulator